MFLYRSLLVLIFLLLGILLGGSVYGLFFKGKEQKPPAENPSAGADTFTGIGRLRVSTREPNPATVIVHIAFPYPAEDREFARELALKVKDFRAIGMDYLSSLSIQELRDRDEQDIKTDLLDRFNAILRLGRIERLDFIDFMILE